MNSQMKHLNEVVLFVLEVSLFSGSKKVKPADLKAARGVELTPDDVLTLGTQKVFDPESLNQLNRLKSAMHRDCLAVGTRFLGPNSYAVPESRAEQLARNLDDIVSKAMAQKTVLVANYNILLDDYCHERPVWAKSIRSNAFSKAYVDERIQFSYVSMQVTAPRVSEFLGSSLDAKASGILLNLLKDVAEIAEKLDECSLLGRESVTRKALRPLKAAREKLLGFTFLDSRIQAVANMIASVEMALPDGPISGSHLAMLTGITEILRSPDRVLAVAQREAGLAEYYSKDEVAQLDCLNPVGWPNGDARAEPISHGMASLFAEVAR